MKDDINFLPTIYKESIEDEENIVQQIVKSNNKKINISIIWKIIFVFIMVVFIAVNYIQYSKILEYGKKNALLQKENVKISNNYKDLNNEILNAKNKIVLLEFEKNIGNDAYNDFFYVENISIFEKNKSIKLNLALQFTKNNIYNLTTNRFIVRNDLLKFKLEDLCNTIKKNFEVYKPQTISSFNDFKLVFSVHKNEFARFENDKIICYAGI